MSNGTTPNLMRALALAALAAAASPGAPAQSPHAGFAPDAPASWSLAPGAFPGEDAVILFAGDYLILHEDGRIDRGQHRVIRLNTDYAVDQLGDPRVPFDSLRQELIVHTCRTFTPDGRVIDARPHAFNRVTPDGVAHCADALPWQEMVITHLGIERGCVVELDVEVRDRFPYSPWLEGTAYFAFDYPVVQRTVSVKCPASVRLNAEMVRGEAEATVVAGNGEAGESGPARIHVWRAENIPAARERDDGCHGCATRSHLLFSTCPGWTELARTVLADLRNAADRDSAMQAWVAEKLRDPELLTPGDRARAISAFTAELIRDATGASFEAYRPARPASRTFASCCGSVWDRATLALALLEEAGIAARVACCPAAPQPVQDVPMLGQFARILLEPDLGDDAGGMLLLDPVAETPLRSPLDWGGRPLLYLGGEREAAWSPGAPEEGRGGGATITVSLVAAETDTLTGTADMVVDGLLCPSGSAANLDDFAASYARRLIPGAQVTSCQASEIGARSARVRIAFAAKAPRDAEGFSRIRMPGGPEDIAALLAHFGLERPQRTTALHLPGGMQEAVTWRIVLPQEWVCTYLPPVEVIANEAGSYTRSQEKQVLPADAEHEGPRQSLTVAWNLEIPDASIDPAGYSGLRQLMQAYSAETGRLLILRPPQGQK